jgi:biopolymer transport protein ExbD
MKIPVDTSEEAKFAMAPMIDMVFLLLVFFMCASRLSQLQTVELEIPDANKAVVPKERPDRVVVNVTSAGDVLVGTQAVADDNELRDVIKQYKESMPDIKVYVRADKESEHKHVRKIMAVMGELGIDDFIFGAFKTE